MRGITGTQNISFHPSTKQYSVQKRFNGINHYVGSFKTLIQALMARDWAVINNWQHYPRQTTTGEKYITRANSGTYCVTKKIKGKTKYYGGFKTLEEAVKYRDFIVSKGWSSNYKYENPMKGIVKTKYGYYVQCYVKQKHHYVGRFNTLENAIEVRDLFIKYEGDWDLICEHDNGERAYLDGKLNTIIQFEKHHERRDWY